MPSQSNADVIYEALTERYGVEGPSGESRSLMDLLVQEYWTDDNFGQRKTGSALKQHYLDLGASGSSLADVERDYWKNIFERVPPAPDPLITFNSVAHTSFDMDAEAYADGAGISSLTDQTGNGRVATQATGTRQPLAQTVNGHKVARFDGVDDFLRTAAFSTLAAQPNTVIVLAKHDDLDTNGRHLFNGINLNTREFIYSAAGTWIINAGTVLQDGVDDALWHVFVARFNGANSSLWVDGGAAVISGDAGGQSLDGVTIGASSGTTPSFYWDGDQNFVGFYDGDLYVDDLALLNSLGQKLADRMGITWTDIT